MKKTFCALCALFIFISNVAVAELSKKERTIKINNIPIIEHVANKVIGNAVENQIDIFDNHNNNIEIRFFTEQYDDIHMAQHLLMDTISELYWEVVNNNKNMEKKVQHREKK